MHAASSQSSPAPAAHTDLPTNENMMGPNTATEEPVRSSEVDLLKRMLSIMEEMRDELKSSNANKERGGGRSEGTLTENISNTLEQAPDIGIEPNNANENPAVSIKEGLDKNMSNTSEQIPHGYIAKDCVEDINAKFWAAHQKSSTEHQIDLVKQMNSDMSTILTFAGLLSAVLATFIVAMQSDSDTTNTLLRYLIQVTVNPDSVPDLSNILSTTGPPTLVAFAQGLAYAGFISSLLAGFGAVSGKQWLNSFKTRGQGTLETRGMQRQMKLNALQSFYMQPIVRLCHAFLQLSLLFLIYSLIFNTSTQLREISLIIGGVTSVGLLFYMGIIFMSVLQSASSFQTPASMLLADICKKMFPKKFPYIHSMFVKSSAVRSILETSTNPEFVDAAAAIVPFVQWPPNLELDASASYARLLENFSLRGYRPELYVKYGKAMAHFCMQPVKIDPELVGKRFSDQKFLDTRSHFIRDAFMAGRAAYDQLNKERNRDVRPNYRADIRTALRTLVVHGQDNRLSRPDDEDLIWDGDLRWCHIDGREPSCEEFDWLVDYLAGDAEHRTDDKTEGDALLALSAMQGLGSSTKQQSYISSLIRCMDSARPPRVRHTALRAVFEAREELASITSASMPPGVDTQLLDNLSRGLLTAVHPKDGHITHDTGPDASFHRPRDYRYIRIIYALTENDEWFQRLARDGHNQRCLSLVNTVCQSRHLFIGFYLLVVFWRIKSSGKDLPFSPAQTKWRSLVKNTWDTLQYVRSFENYVDGIPALVAVTRLNLTASDSGVPREWFTDLAAIVHKVLVNFQRAQAALVNNDIGQAAIDTALSSIQSLYDDLGCCGRAAERSAKGP